MRMARKGFTLVELLIVITIIGILSSMMMLQSSDAQNAAMVVKISEGFRNLEAAMLLYYNADYVKAEGADAAAIVTGAKKYLKNKAAFGTSDTTAGTYYVKKEGNTWWLSYYLPGATGVMNDLLKAKAKEFAFKKEAKATPSEAEAYEGGQTVWYNVR